MISCMGRLKTCSIPPDWMISCTDTHADHKLGHHPGTCHLHAAGAPVSARLQAASVAHKQCHRRSILSCRHFRLCCHRKPPQQPAPCVQSGAEISGNNTHACIPTNSIALIHCLCQNVLIQSCMVQVLLSLEVYLMLPYLLHSLQPMVSLAAAIACSISCCGLLSSSPTILPGFIAAIAFVTFVYPFWLVAMQMRCANVSGQWDVADVTGVCMH
jgi:hypothetical protein